MWSPTVDRSPPSPGHYPCPWPSQQALNGKDSAVGYILNQKFHCISIRYHYEQHTLITLPLKSLYHPCMMTVMQSSVCIAVDQYINTDTLSACTQLWVSHKSDGKSMHHLHLSRFFISSRMYICTCTDCYYSETAFEHGVNHSYLSVQCIYGILYSDLYFHLDF